MENFFNRQVERLEFTTARMAKRVLEKKELDALEAEPKVMWGGGGAQVCMYIRRMGQGIVRG